MERMFKVKYVMMGIHLLYQTVRMIALDQLLDTHVQEVVSPHQEHALQTVEMAKSLELNSAMITILLILMDVLLLVQLRLVGFAILLFHPCVLLFVGMELM